MLLTIIYFGMAREGLEEEHHGATSTPQRVEERDHMNHALAS